MAAYLSEFRWDAPGGTVRSHRRVGTPPMRITLMSDYS